MVSTILTNAAALLDSIGLCQGAYGLSANNDPIPGLAGVATGNLNAIDILGAIHRAAYEASMLGDEAAARDAVADYIGYAQREDTSGTVIRVWNDEPGRDTESASTLLETVVDSL